MIQSHASLTAGLGCFTYDFQIANTVECWNRQTEVAMVDGIAPAEKCGEFQDISTEDEKASWELLWCWNPWFGWTLECGFGTNRMSAFWTPFVGCPFLDLLIHDPTHLKQKRSHWNIGKQKVRFRCGFSEWLVPITFGFLTIRVSSSSHFWVIFWSICLPGFMWKLPQIRLTISHSSHKPFAHVGSVAGNHHPQEVWWRSLHHWQVPQGRLLLFELNQGGGNQQSTASKVYFQTGVFIV